MKTIEERLADLEAEVAKIPRRGKWVGLHERDLRESALQYARIKTHGFILETDGTRIILDPSQVDVMLAHFDRKMKRAGEDLLIELSMEAEPSR